MFLVQFAFGGLVLGGDMLKIIEEALTSDPVERLQDGFNAYDECSQISKKLGISIALQKYNFVIGRDDECVTAGDIYSCGRQKEPMLVDAIFNVEQGNNTFVGLNSIFEYFVLLNLVIKSTCHLLCAWNTGAVVVSRENRHVSLM
jgi:hypothetical protein